METADLRTADAPGAGRSLHELRKLERKLNRLATVRGALVRLQALLEALLRALAYRWAFSRPARELRRQPVCDLARQVALRVESSAMDSPDVGAHAHRQPRPSAMTGKRVSRSGAHGTSWMR